MYCTVPTVRPVWVNRGVLAALAMPKSVTRAQVLALDVLHDEIGAAVDLAGLVDADDVRVGQAGGGARLVGEAGDEVGVERELGPQDLDRHRAVEALVLGAVDRR